MKVLQKILFIMIAVIGLSVGAFAQKHDPKRPPPKDTPPVVTPNVKPPKGDDKPKKPRSSNVIYLETDRRELA